MKDNIFIKIFNHIEETLLSAAFIAMTLICFIQVITRYILHFSLPWSEEVLRALFVWSSCLGISIAFRTKSHMGVDAVVNLFPRKAKFALSIISYLIVIAFCVIMSYFSAGVTWKQIATQQTTIALRMPIAYVSISLVVGFSLTIIRIIQALIDDIKNRKDNEEMHISEGLL